MTTNALIRIRSKSISDVFSSTEWEEDKEDLLPKKDNGMCVEKIRELIILSQKSFWAADHDCKNLFVRFVIFSTLIFLSVANFTKYSL